MKSAQRSIVALLLLSALWQGVAMALEPAPPAAAANDGGQQDGARQPAGEADEEPECD